MEEAQPIRAAATVILTRAAPGGGHQVLMGQRGAGAAFMPSKYVFPGGGVDPGDDIAAPLPVPPDCARRLALSAAPGPLVAAAIRELSEETGLLLRADRPTMRFVFRAITPPGRPRRFDTRFFALDVTDVPNHGMIRPTPDSELVELVWVPLSGTDTLETVEITRIILDELKKQVATGFDKQQERPFYRARYNRFERVRL